MALAAYPNAGHIALALLALATPQFLMVTQNIDGEEDQCPSAHIFINDAFQVFPNEQAIRRKSWLPYTVLFSPFVVPMTHVAIPAETLGMSLLRHAWSCLHWTSQILISSCLTSARKIYRAALNAGAFCAQE